MPSIRIWMLEESVTERVFRAAPSIASTFAAMAIVAYAFGRLSRTDWVWWLAPLTVALEGTRFIRADLRNSEAAFASSADSTDAESETSLYVTSCAIATGMAIWGAYAGSRVAIITATAGAVICAALDWTEQPVCVSRKRLGITSVFDSRGRGPR